MSTAPSPRAGAKRGAAAQIDFFYDVASPYSWLAFETLTRYHSEGWWNVKVTLRPFFLGGVMKATGNRPPYAIEAKRLYMGVDLARMSRMSDVPVVPLEDPRAMLETLAAQRLLSAAAIDAPGKLEALTREVWRRIWGGGGDIAGKQGLREACTAAGMDADLALSLLARSEEEDVKARLKEETDEALRRGAFGAPWITLRTSADVPWEAFFGCDRFEALAAAMGQPWLGPRPDLSKL